MSPEEIESRFASLNVWRRDGARAPHKPLLALWMLGRWHAGERGPVPFDEVDAAVGDLLRDHLPADRVARPELPFWHLQNDGVWMLDGGVTQRPPGKVGSAPPKGVLKDGVSGHFAPAVAAAFEADADMVRRVAQSLVVSHFPASLRADVLTSLGLPANWGATTPEVEDDADVDDPRAALFRPSVLIAYRYRCAVCGFNVRLGTRPVAIDAAHIRWRQAGGEHAVTNGIAMCALHHRLFDAGAFTLSTAQPESDSRVLLSELVVGDGEAADRLIALHGRPLTPPQRDEDRPTAEHLDWHRSEVFRGRPLP